MRRRWSIWKCWLAFVGLCALFAVTQIWHQVVFARVSAAQRQWESIASDIEWQMHWYAVRERLEDLEHDFNQGRPLRREPVWTRFGPAQRVVVGVSQLGPKYARWSVQIDYNTASSYRLNTVKAIGPPMPAKWDDFLGEQIVQRLMEGLGKLVMIGCGGVWVVSFLSLFFAGRWRRTLAQLCIASGLFAFLSWAIDPRRPQMWKVAKLNWIAVLCLAGLGVGLLALIVPSRRRSIDRGRCSSCGYDLTGNVSGICPECGQPTSAELRRRRDEELRPLATAIGQTTDDIGEVSPGAEMQEEAG